MIISSYYVHLLTRRTPVVSPFFSNSRFHRYGFKYKKSCTKHLSYRTIGKTLDWFHSSAKPSSPQKDRNRRLWLRGLDRSVSIFEYIIGLIQVAYQQLLVVSNFLQLQNHKFIQTNYLCISTSYILQAYSHTTPTENILRRA